MDQGIYINLPEGYERPFIMFGIVEPAHGLRAVEQLEVEKPATGMALEAHVEVSDERPGKEMNIFVFRA